MLFYLWESSDDVDPNEAACSGTFHSVKTCADLGFSRDCGGDCWANPGMPCVYAGCPDRR